MVGWPCPKRLPSHRECTTPLLEARYVTPCAVSLKRAHGAVWARAAILSVYRARAGADAAAAGCNADTLTL